jgi:hypothetical protein
MLLDDFPGNVPRVGFFLDQFGELQMAFDIVAVECQWLILFGVYDEALAQQFRQRVLRHAFQERWAFVKKRFLNR